MFDEHAWEASLFLISISKRKHVGGAPGRTIHVSIGND